MDVTAENITANIDLRDYPRERLRLDLLGERIKQALAGTLKTEVVPADPTVGELYAP